MNRKKMTYCKKCMYPFVAANLHIDSDGICGSCRTFEQSEKITEDDWAIRKKKLDTIIENIKKNNKGNYDCIIPVSGGKDSFYQIHLMCKEYN